MRVQVEIVCAPHPRDDIQEALELAGFHLTSVPDTVSVQVHRTEPLTASLEFEMPAAAQYKVVDHIYATVKSYVWQFYEDMTIRFPKS